MIWINTFWTAHCNYDIPHKLKTKLFDMKASEEVSFGFHHIPFYDPHMNIFSMLVLTHFDLVKTNVSKLSKVVSK